MKEGSAAAASTAILVLGMHRSGTSATTRVLNLLGAELGSNLLDPQTDNRKGFWEHQEAVRIHERLLSGLGLDWHDLCELPSGWLEHPASLKASEEIVELIRRDFSGRRLWAVKDPRMCRLAPLWIRALDQIGIRAIALIVVRDPREVAASLRAREGWSHAHSWLMWTQHVLESIEATEQIPRAMLNYDDLMKDWASNITRIGDELGVSWPRSIGDARPGIEDFLSTGDRHHQASEVAAANQVEHPPPKWLMQLMDQCAALGAGRGDWSALVAPHGDYVALAELFAGPIAELTRDRKALRQVAAERMDVIDGIQRELAAHSSHLKDAMTALDQRSNQHQILQQVLEAKSIAMNQLSNQHQILQQALEEKSIAMNQLSNQYQDMQDAMTALQQARLGLEQQLERARAITRSRSWLLRRVIQITTRGSSATDADFG